MSIIYFFYDLSQRLVLVRQAALTKPGPIWWRGGGRQEQAPWGTGYGESSISYLISCFVFAFSLEQGVSPRMIHQPSP